MTVFRLCCVVLGHDVVVVRKKGANDRETTMTESDAWTSATTTRWSRGGMRYFLSKASKDRAACYKPVAIIVCVTFVFPRSQFIVLGDETVAPGIVT